MMFEIAKVSAILIAGPCLAATLMLWTLKFFIRIQSKRLDETVAIERAILGATSIDRTVTLERIKLNKMEALHLASLSTALQEHTNSPEKQITISFDFDGEHVELKGITHLRVAQGSFAERQDSMLTPETSSIG